MKKAIGAILAAGMVLVSGPALAQPNVGDEFEGTLRVQKGIPVLYCDFKAEFLAGSKVDVTVTGGTPGCTSFTLNNRPYDYTFSSPSNLTILNVNVATTLTPGDCEGDVVADLVSDVISVDTILAGGGGSANCSLEGDLFLI